MTVDFRRQSIPYSADSSVLFETLADEPWAVFLDSGRPASVFGRYDIITAYPRVTLSTKGETTENTQSGHQQKVRGNPFVLLKQHLNKAWRLEEDIPFAGGAVGYFAYDLGRRIERIPTIASDDLQMPEMAVGIYDWALIVDHEKKQSYVVGDVGQPRVRLLWDELIERFTSQETTQQVSKQRAPFRSVSDVQSNMSEQEYANKFQRVKDYIREGDCYQVNLAQRFQVEVEGHPWNAYKQLRTINPAHFAAYMNTPDAQILSVSPERFLQVKDRRVETKPIKGTRPRKKNPGKDALMAETLRNSTKDQAENVMIVDLLRNDLSKCCVPQSVQVPKLFAIESFPTVHHMVSTVIGTLPENGHPVHLLRECFPGGSITGAPKIRAMEIIEELEPHRRNLYCGSIGYIGFEGNMDTNIAIRTLIHKNESMYFYAGGGLVWDSQMKDEYQETYDKAAAMFTLLQQAAS